MAPFYGYVKRSMNRAPGKNDTWWSQHAAKCSGSFIKVSEPELFKKKQEEKKMRQETKENKSASTQPSCSSSFTKFKTLDSFLTGTPQILSQNNKKDSTQSQSQSQIVKKSEPRSKIPKLDDYFEKKVNDKKSEKDNDLIICLSDDEGPSLKRKTPLNSSARTSTDFIVLNGDEESLSECPMCFLKLSQHLINSHVNSHF